MYSKHPVALRIISFNSMQLINEKQTKKRKGNASTRCPRFNVIHCSAATGHYKNKVLGTQIFL